MLKKKLTRFVEQESNLVVEISAGKKLQSEAGDVVGESELQEESLENGQKVGEENVVKNEYLDKEGVQEHKSICMKMVSVH